MYTNPRIFVCCISTQYVLSRMHHTAFLSHLHLDQLTIYNNRAGYFIAVQAPWHKSTFHNISLLCTCLRLAPRVDPGLPGRCVGEWMEWVLCPLGEIQEPVSESMSIGVAEFATLLNLTNLSHEITPALGVNSQLCRSIILQSTW